MSEQTKTIKGLRDFGEDAREIIGIRITKSKKSGNNFYTYFCKSNFSAYDTENAEALQGTACEVVGCSTDLGLVVGDIVEFNYGKAIGDYQPIKSVSMLSPSAFKDAEK